MKEVSGIVTIIILFFFLISSQAIAQNKDACGCIVDKSKNQISVPYFRNSLNIQFFYCVGTGPDFFSPALISQVVYSTWDGFTYYFPTVNNMAVIKFDWRCLMSIPQWNFIKYYEGEIYLGLYYDTAKNHAAENVRIFEIVTSCFYPQRSRDTRVLTIKVYLVDK